MIGMMVGGKKIGAFYQTPIELLRHRKFNSGLQYMTGVTTQEAAFFLSQNESLAPYYEIDNKFFDQKVLGLHFERAYQGELRYLNLNTTYNSSILLNYRQTECAFWTQYLPTVIGVLVPTYPPTTEFWWEPKEPLQIAFWKYDQQSRAAGVDNSNLVTNHHVRFPRQHLRISRFTFNETLASKVLTDTTSIRSPSSLAMTQKSGSKINGGKRLLQRDPVPLSSTPVPSEPSYAKPTKTILQNRSTTPTPSARTTTTTTATISSGSSVLQPLPIAPPKPQTRTQVIEGVPQTSV
ncbi:hypothetical protein EVAR_101715_1 [Eumeta japonica]|uniref:Uncharacterized protein n=1 Tax=Eumeta variegata TaxID=151549 RepID=A0A4C1TLJ5_EUMVA|nr:hypothetical protein EVAR_101715_1 [Eumeta japonica]